MPTEHVNETRWAAFVALEGKVGHRWYLWVFHSRSVVHYVLDASRAATVVQGELDGVVGGIGELYHLNSLRLQFEDGSAERACHHAELQQAVQRMSDKCDAALADPWLAKPAIKVLQSMKNHWSGLTVFVAHPWVPMDNNTAERDARLAVVGRKNFYGSGSEWSGQLAAAMYSLVMTVKLCKLNARSWLSAYLQACADNGNQAPQDINAFLPWAMDEARLTALREGAPGVRNVIERIDSS